MDDEGAIVERDWYDVFSGESGFVIADPRDPDIVYGSNENLIGRFNKHTMQEQVISVWPIDASGHAAKDLEHRFNWTSPLIMSPFDPDTLYYGMERLYRTSDDGGSWSAISPDLTRNDKSRQQASGGPITKDITSVEYYDTIFAIAESPLSRGMIWVGTDDGLIQLTRNGGGSWANVTPREMPEWSTISMIEPSRYDANTAYVAVDRHKLDDIQPYIFMTDDGGSSWARIDAGVPEGSFVHAVREDSLKRDLLYAATETGVFVSFDAGRHWQSLQLNLPRSPVHDLVVKGNDLVVATHGRSFWILDDVTPLREVAAAASASAAYLYAPETGYRLHYPDEVDMRPPVGQNPPAGILIDYYLSSTPAGALSIDILDAKGRHGAPSHQREGAGGRAAAGISGSGASARHAAGGAGHEPLRLESALRRPRANSGRLLFRPAATRADRAARCLHRQAHLRGADADRTADSRRPIRASRGRSRGCSRSSRSSMEVYHDLDALHRAVNDIRALKGQVAAALKEAHGRPNSVAITAEGNALLKQAAQIEEQLMQVQHQRGRKPISTFPAC